MRLGVVYGQRNQAHFRSKRTRCIHSLGRKRKKQKALDRFEKALYHRKRAPFPLVRLQRIFWKQTFLPNQCLFRKQRHIPHRLEFKQLKQNGYPVRTAVFLLQ